MRMESVNMFKWLCLLFVLNVLFESIYLYIKSVNSVQVIDVPRKWTMLCFIPTMCLFGIWIKTLYGDLGTFPFTATLFMAQLIIALIYGVTIIVLYYKVILKLVMRRKIKPKYKVEDIVKCKHIDIPLTILAIKKGFERRKILYILEYGIVIPESLIIEVVDEQK